MLSSKPTNGELMVMLSSIKETAAVSHGQMLKELGEIKTQATLTNGRVRKLEAWKYALSGALMLLNLIAVPLLIQWLQGRLIH